MQEHKANYSAICGTNTGNILNKVNKLFVLSMRWLYDTDVVNTPLISYGWFSFVWWLVMVFVACPSQDHCSSICDGCCPNISCDCEQCSSLAEICNCKLPSMRSCWTKPCPDNSVSSFQKNKEPLVYLYTIDCLFSTADSVKITIELNRMTSFLWGKIPQVEG